MSREDTPSRAAPTLLDFEWSILRFALLSYANVSPNLLATAAIANQGGSLDPAAFSCADCGTVSSSFSNFYNQAIISNVGAIETSQSGTEFRVQGNKLVPQAAGVVPTHTFKNIEQEYYVQDQWKATSQLTLTFGVRYVYLGVPYEKDGQQIAPTIPLDTFFANRESAAASGTGYDTRISFRASGSPNGQPNFWTPQKYNFAPRFAFAYATKDNKTAIHGGFSIAYDHFGEGVIDSYQSNSHRCSRSRRPISLPSRTSTPIRASRFQQRSRRGWSDRFPVAPLHSGGPARSPSTTASTTSRKTPTRRPSSVGAA